MDYVNYKRYKILKTKTVKITATNFATAGGIDPYGGLILVL